MATTLDQYIARFGFCPRQVNNPPSGDLGLVVVIPCHAEPDLTGCLEALWRCDPPRAAVEVILVVNAPSTASAALRLLHDRAVALARQWSAAHCREGFSVHVLRFEELPPKHAGVGLARKIGMDEGLHRLAWAGREGILICFDADCACAPSFLRCVEEHFEGALECPACGIYFEHPLSGPLGSEVYEAGARYELHLRYYVQALRWASYPFAFQTIGSCMAVRAGVYMAQGGMNKRKAGEDFYFLHKIIPLGGFRDLANTVVYPSPRPSERVPFGTGRAVGEQLAGRPMMSYPLEAFRDLRGWLRDLDVSRIEAWQTSAPPAVRSFLEARGFAGAWEEIKANAKESPALQRRWWRWFDGFKAMKYVHHARDHFYGAAPIEDVAARLLANYQEAAGNGLLERYRFMARTGEWLS